jgi:hypothetical protein
MLYLVCSNFITKKFSLLQHAAGFWYVGLSDLNYGVSPSTFVHVSDHSSLLPPLWV